MASAFAHAALALGIAAACRRPEADGPTPRRAWLLFVGCSLLPDADVLAFAYGIPYEHLFGHRGITHSILAGLAVGLLAARAVPRDLWPTHRARLAVGLVVATISHGVLDAMTTGGLGVAFFAPFENGRHFLPWRPILVSPIGVGRFLSERGLRILANEAAWVGLPALGLALASQAVRRLRRRSPLGPPETAAG